MQSKLWQAETNKKPTKECGISGALEMDDRILMMLSADFRAEIIAQEEWVDKKSSERQIPRTYYRIVSEPRR
eukprot:Gb_38330 [translate_table: standard]